MKINILLFVLAVASLYGCEKDIFVAPEIQMVSVTALSPTTANFVGNISKLGSEKILDYGFIYNYDGPADEDRGIKVSLGNTPTIGEFKVTTDLSGPAGSTSRYMIWVRPYLQDAKGTVFGATQQMTLPSPSATGIVPAFGKSGDLVKIKGKFYNPELDDISVSFQGVKARVIAVTDSEITVEVPTGISATHGQSVSLTVGMGGVAPHHVPSFTILANFKNFSPKSGPVGTAITFSGDNLPNSYYYNFPIFVHVGNRSLPASSYFNSIVVPYTVEVTSQIAVTTGDQRKVLPEAFTVTPPQITSTNLTEVFPGQQIMINGTNFPPNIDYDNRPMIRLGTAAYQNVSSYSTSHMYFSVPQNTPGGTHTLSLKLGPHEVQAPREIKVLAYSVTGFSPTSGGPGTVVDITGNFMQGQGYTVRFGSLGVYTTAPNSTSLRVQVPAGIDAGMVDIAVDVPNSRLTAPGKFEVIGPSFTSFSPSSAVPGALITIKGEGFYPDRNRTAVRFGTVSVTPNSVTESTIVVAVPSNVATGAMKLTVVTNNQSVSHNDNFILLN